MADSLDTPGSNTGSIALGSLCHKSATGRGTISSCSRKRVPESNSAASKDAVPCWLSGGCSGPFDRVGSCASAVAGGPGMAVQFRGCRTGEDSVGCAIVSGPSALRRPFRVFSGVSLMWVLFTLDACAWTQASTVRDVASEDDGSADSGTMMP